MALLIAWASQSATKTRLSIPSTAVALVASLVFAVLSYAEHTRSICPSLMLSGYLFLTSLFDAAQCRTLWLQHYNHNISYIFTAGAVVKLTLLVLESSEKRHILLPRYQACPPEATSGLFSKCFFWWLSTYI